MAKFRKVRTLQKFVSTHAAVYNLFNLERHLVSRSIFKKRHSTTMAEWRLLAA
jgi:putative transposase